MPDPKISEHKEYKILIGTPANNGQCHAAYAISLVKTFSLIAKIPNIKLLHKFILNDSLVPRTRNQLAAYVLSDPSITHLLFIDSDIQWDPKDIIKLLSNNKPVCAATCAKRGYRWERLKTKKLKDLLAKEDLSDPEFKEKVKAHLVDYNVNFGATRKVEEGVIEVEEIGTGFMLITREVFEKLASSHPELKLKDPSLGLEEKAREFFYCFFDLGIHEGIYYSEDYSFCKKWKTAGGKIYADLSINLSHFGMEEYQGNILDISSIMKK